MNKKVLVLGRQDVGEKNDAFILANAIDRQTSIEIIGGYYENIVLDIRQKNAHAFLHNDGTIHDISSFDTIIMINWSFHRLYTDIAHSIAVIARHANVTIWNEELLDARSSTKVSQLVELSYEDVTIPDTVFSLTPLLAESYVAHIQTPFIAKDPLASRGRNNYLCHSWDDFIAQSDRSVSYVIQQFIPNDHSDLRMFVLAKKPKLAILRQGPQDSHLNNISTGSSGTLIDCDKLPERLLQDTEFVARHFKRDLCGIDFMKNEITGEYIFLEINTTPQIVNGAFVDEKIAAFVNELESE